MKDVPLFALCGGAALFLLGHVGRRARRGHGISVHRLLGAAALLACVPVLREIGPDAIVSLAVVMVLLVGLVTYETLRFAETRARTRHDLNHHAVS